MYGDARKRIEEKKLAWALHPNICVINDQLAPCQTEEVNTVSADARASVTMLGCKEELLKFFSDCINIDVIKFAGCWKLFSKKYPIMLIRLIHKQPSIFNHLMTS